MLSTTRSKYVGGYFRSCSWFLVVVHGLSMYFHGFPCFPWFFHLFTIANDAIFRWTLRTNDFEVCWPSYTIIPDGRHPWVQQWNVLFNSSSPSWSRTAFSGAQFLRRELLDASSSLASTNHLSGWQLLNKQMIFFVLCFSRWSTDAHPREGSYLHLDLATGPIKNAWLSEEYSEYSEEYWGILIELDASAL